MHRDFRKEIKGVQRWYDSIACDFVGRYEGKEGEYFRSFEEEEVEKLVPFSTRILDLGCGHGRIASRISQRGQNLVVAVDISMEMLRQGLSHKFQRLQANAVELSFKDESFDTVISMGMFEYLEDPTPFLMEINRILRPGGELILTFHQIKPSYQPPLEDGDASYFGKKVRERNALWKRVTRSLKEMSRYLLECGFVVEKVRRVFFRLPTAMFKIGVGLRRFSNIIGNGLVAVSKIAEKVMSALFSANSNGNTIILARKRQ